MNSLCWQRAKFLYVGISFATFLACSSAAELVSLGAGDKAVDACVFNVRKDNARMFWRTSSGTLLGTFDRIKEELQSGGERLYCASNAGIYGKDLHPIGLYVQAGQVERKLNLRKEGYGNFYMQPNGVFLLAQNKASIMTTDEVQNNWEAIVGTLRYATQSGPLMLQAGQINSAFTPGSSNRVLRNAVCTKSSTDVALVKSRVPINFYDFSQVLRDELGCQDALYLDGSISELYPFDRGSIGPRFGVMVGVVVPDK